MPNAAQPPEPPAASTLVTAANFAALSTGLPAIARAAFGYALKLERGTLHVRLPDLRWFRFDAAEPGPTAILVVRDYGFAKRLIKGGNIGFAEAYMAGEWDSPDVTAFLEFFCVNQEVIRKLLPGRPVFHALEWLRHRLRRNTKAQAQRNIHAHYDLGNQFYSSWLDRTMTYSSAMFAPGDNDLSSAQQRKYRVLADAIGLAPEHHVLEIGCGWGGFAEFAAREIGCRVTGLTISRAQYDYAVRRIAEAGFADRVAIKFQDYRDETGRYDRIASIEMFEAVGEAFWPAYFAKLAETLKPSGVAGLQVITIQDRLFGYYRRDVDFIRRYIFPGGMLPSPTILKALGQRFGLPLKVERIFPEDYARTLAQWRERFWRAWPNLTMLGFDERFKRLWEYYLHYCEAGFKAGNIDVRQMVFAKG